ncbi:MAG: ATP phosphoribosyltransferase regulatory subunit [Pseudomonadota bacterium]
MMDPAAREARVAALLARFEGAGARRVAPEALQPAETLLDLYGEDIRARAYTTEDPVAGEQMLRPDFTVPVVRAHIAAGRAAGRYAYAGPVWRRQEWGSPRPVEYWQAGIEAIGDPDPAAADAEIFALIAGALEGRDLTPATGDMGVLIAAVAALPLSPGRRAALRRHLWRPARFHALLAAYAAPPEPSLTRRAILAAVAEGRTDAAIAAAGPAQGLRSPEEIAERTRALAEEAREPALPAELLAALDALLAIAAPADAALSAMRTLPLQGTGPALDRMARRLDALAARGIEPGALPFEGAFGRTTLEYYDGFVFGFADGSGPVASGGRYDQLMRALGGAAPAVGAIIRPERLT